MAATMPKGQYDRAASAWTPLPRREYDPGLVDRVVRMYETGMTVSEVDRLFPGVKVQRLLERHAPNMRRAVKRDQAGPSNTSWRGGAAGYQAMHLRVQIARGKPDECTRCDRTGSDHKYEWANQTGNYEDVWDYARMCISCHRRFDAARRSATGMNTMPTRR